MGYDDGDDSSERLEHWRLNEELSIYHAALLYAGVNPSGKYAASINWKPHEQPVGFGAAVLAFSAALRKDAITGRKVQVPDYDNNGNICGEIDGKFDISETSADVDSLKRWLTARGVRTGFFFPASPPGATVLDAPGYLDPAHPRYSNKLAATVQAWLAVETTIPGKSPKASLERWLREHAAEFELTDNAGNPVAKAMEECSIVANWKPRGGVENTPGG